eukprot:NODE_218_length_14160_cov_0.274874.p4 type:complete len:574 gc:universal NODE_218_length_14160_cov_0.274874:6031-4310(-)
MSSLLYQILIPFQISVPCIYPSSSFEYSFHLLDDTIFKIDLSPYPIKIQSRFFTASVSYNGMIGQGHAYIDKESSCIEFPPLTVEFTLNQTSYKLEKKNKNFVINSNIIEQDTSNAAESENLLCGTNATVDAASFDILSNKQMQMGTASTACPLVTQYLDIGIAVDCSITRQSENIETVTQEVLSNLAKTNVAFKKFFNIQLVVGKLDIRSSCSQTYVGASSEVENTALEFDRWNIPCRNDYSLMQRVSDFSKWRGGRKDNLALWHLFSGCASDGKVGLAWPSAMCYKDSVKASGNLYFSGAGVSTRQKNSWKVMAHEIAHNLGAIHDCLAPTLGGCCQCSSSSDGDCNGEYLMNPSQKVATDDFSPCTVETVCKKLDSFSCLSSTTTSFQVFQKNTCGNGILEEGEECDCGDLCDSDRCCTKDCKLTLGSTCSDKNQGCCSGCQLKSKNTVCRKSEGVCDHNEFCSGTDANCPPDKFVKDGESCSDDGIPEGHCASKYCTSPDKQCTDAYPLSKGSCTSSINNAATECSLNCAMSSGCAAFDSMLITGTLCGGGYGKCKLGVCEYSNGCNSK